MKPREFILDVVSGEFYDIEWDGDLADGKYVLRQILPETTDVVPEFPTAEYRLWENAHLLLPNSSLYPGDAARWAWSARGKAACKPDKPEAAESVEAVRFAALEKCDEMYGPYGDDVPNTKCFMTGIDWLLARLKQSEG